MRSFLASTSARSWSKIFLKPYTDYFKDRNEPEEGEDFTRELGSTDEFSRAESDSKESSVVVLGRNSSEHFLQLKISKGME